ncbi:protease Do-like 14 [Populus alba x Populus x berolinensis]|nr:protease Do-like 14 [Populus alba x Populus x berolinensis]
MAIRMESRDVRLMEKEIRSPWQRKARPRTVGCVAFRSHSFEESFDKRIEENFYLDLPTKLSALKASQSVVSLVSRARRGVKNILVFPCSGTIIGSKLEENGSFTHTILTSANLLITRAASTSEDHPPLAPEPGIKVYVYLSSGDSFEGEIFGFNFHYNIAIIKFKSSSRFPTAILKHIDGSIPLTTKAELQNTSFGLRPHAEPSDLFNLCPGEKVIALGRHYLSHSLMVAPVTYTWFLSFLHSAVKTLGVRRPGWYWGTLINCNGEVIGINFHEHSYTSFLPINIASRCLECLEKNGKVPQPWFGVKVTSCNAISANIFEKIIQKFGNINEGVFVEEVIPESPACSSGVRPNDIIIRCGKQAVVSSSEFYGTLLDNTGESMEVIVMRPCLGRDLSLTIKVIDETNPKKYYRWPVPEEAF